MLTERQHRLLMYIYERQRKNGVTPSFEEMRLAMGLRSKSGIHQIITALQERGFIKRLHNRARALEILNLPEDVFPQSSAGIEAQQSTREVSPTTAPTANTGMELPFLGRIAAGRAIEAIEYNDESLHVPEMLVGRGEHFVLEVSGDSMIDAGILDGDYVLIKKQHTAHNGDIVVACIDREEVTLKRIQTQGASVALKPENPAFQTQIYGGDRIEIKGILAGLIRRY